MTDNTFDKARASLEIAGLPIEKADYEPKNLTAGQSSSINLQQKTRLELKRRDDVDRRRNDLWKAISRRVAKNLVR